MVLTKKVICAGLEDVRRNLGVEFDGNDCKCDEAAPKKLKGRLDSGSEINFKQILCLCFCCLHEGLFGSNFGCGL